MSTLPILIAPDRRLKQTATAVGRVDSAIRQLMDSMLTTMYGSQGIGLAAPQVGVLKRVIVVDVSGPEEIRQPHRMADPELVWRSEERVTGEEGCLSLPEQYAEVNRPAAIRVRFRDETDQLRELEANGLLARCIQHEIDHLDGILFVDHLSSLKRGIILRKITKARRQDTAQAG
jgi:peptide deformylase